MSNILTIFLKEFKDTIRDRRTLLLMTLMPLLLIPVLTFFASSITSSGNSKAMDKVLRVAIESNGNGAELIDQLKLRKDVLVYENIDFYKFHEFIREDSLDFAIQIDPEFDKAVQSGKTAELELIYNSTKDSLLFVRLASTLKSFSSKTLDTRLDSAGLKMEFIKPLRVTETDVLTTNESFGKMIGSSIPYFFVIFCLMGAMYPAIDLFTGEKERGTIETILSVPATRLEILFGKMLVVVLSGVISGVLTLIGLYATLKLNTQIPEFIRTSLLQILDPSAVLWIVLMLIPLTAFFAGVLIPASIYSRSFKEAQSTIQPMMFVAIFPLLMVAISPVELNALTAMVPILNVALASREIIAGTIDYSMLLIVFISLFAFAFLGIMLCRKWFSEEGNIFRM